MADKNAVVSAAAQLYRERDETSLEVLIGMRAAAIEHNSLLADDPYFEPKYDGQTMGALDEARRLGTRVVTRWNRELCALVCGTQANESQDRKAVLDSLNLGETAVIAAVASALLSLGAAAALAAALAPLIVKRFIWPAKDELCAAWREASGQ